MVVNIMDFIKIEIEMVKDLGYGLIKHVKKGYGRMAN